MKIVRGDLIEKAKNKEFDVIVHGANCINQMGSGIAAQIKDEFPAAFDADTIFEFPLGKSRLGKISIAYDGKYNLWIVNAYTQLAPAKNKFDVAVDYEAVRSTMRTIKEQFNGFKIGMPFIGAGLANGDWHTIATIICEELAGEDVIVVEYDKFR